MSRLMPAMRAARAVMTSLGRVVAGYAVSRAFDRSANSVRLAVFPKRTHELGFHEGIVPNGLSPDYVELALRLNTQSAGKTVSHNPAESLLRLVEFEVAHAAVNERRLVNLLNEHHEASSR